MSLILSYTDTMSITTTIALPSPEFNDSLEKDYRKIIRESRGKDLIIFAKLGASYVGQYKKQEYKFRYIPEPIKQQLMLFLDATLGLLVSITDYNSVTYNGIILTSSIEIINASRNNNEITLEIEVVA